MARFKYSEDYADKSKDYVVKELMDADKEIYKYKEMIRNLYLVIVRGAFLLKLAVRIASVVGCFMWLGKQPAIALAFTHVLLMILQLISNKARCAINSQLDFSEWDVPFN